MECRAVPAGKDGAGPRRDPPDRSVPPWGCSDGIGNCPRVGRNARPRQGGRPGRAWAVCWSGTGSTWPCWPGSRSAAAVRGKAGGADVVQETFLEAHRDFAGFRGDDGGGAGRLAAADPGPQPGRPGPPVPRHPPPRRPAGAGAGGRAGPVVATGWRPPWRRRRARPSQQAARLEQAVLLADALGRLPADYREVLVLRHLEGLTFPEVAGRMGRSVDSVKKLWARGAGPAPRGCCRRRLTDDRPATVAADLRPSHDDPRVVRAAGGVPGRRWRPAGAPDRGRVPGRATPTSPGRWPSAWTASTSSATPAGRRPSWPRPAPGERRTGSATSGSSGRSAAAGWGWCTRPSSVASAGGWR